MQWCKAPDPAVGTDEKSVELAYDSAREILKSQDTTLGNLRTRAGSLLTTAALLTSFSTALGLINLDPARGAVLPPWAAWALLGALVGLGALVLFVFWPVKTWHFGPHPGVILEKADDGKSLSMIRRYVTERMLAGMGDNAVALRRRQTAFRWSVGLLLAEVSVLVIALTTTSN
jgi:hypothetical protein